MRKRIIIGVLCLLLGAAALELASRFILGLGDPPLYVAHPAIEYMLQPRASYKCFGNVFRSNRYGMRSDEMPLEKRTNEVRILVLGDSIPNGGSLTDQDELATEILKRELTGMLCVPVVVGNVSAGSWSPPNLCAYIKEYGSFDAELSVIILNKDDLYDFPSFDSLDPRTHPIETPLTASGELIRRYVWPRVAALFSRGGGAVGTAAEEANRATCLPALSELVQRLQARGCDVWVLYHPSRDEIDDGGRFVPAAAFALVQDFTVRNSLPLLSLASHYGNAVRNGQSPFRDAYHPTPYGQALMAQEILQALVDGGWIGRWESRL